MGDHDERNLEGMRLVKQTKSNYGPAFFIIWKPVNFLVLS